MTHFISHSVIITHTGKEDWWSPSFKVFFIRRGDQDGRVEGCRAQLLSINTSNIQQQMEKFSWNLTGDWQEDFVPTKAVRNTHTESREGKRSNLCWDPCHRREHRKGRGVGVWQGWPPWGTKQFKPHIGHWGLGSDTGKMISLATVKLVGINSRAVRNLDSSREEHTHTCLLLKEGRRRDCPWSWPFS